MAPDSILSRVMAVRLLSVALGGILFVLLVLAYALPPDPTWIGGVWDDGDSDDAIFLSRGPPLT